MFLMKVFCIYFLFLSLFPSHIMAANDAPLALSDSLLKELAEMRNLNNVHNLNI